MRYPWSTYPPRKKAKVLVAIFLTFIAGLLVYSNVDRYVYFTLSNALSETASSFRIERAVLIVKPPREKCVLNITFSFENPTDIDQTLVGFSAKLLDWYLWKAHAVDGGFRGRGGAFTELRTLNISMKPIPAHSKLPLSREKVDIIAQSGYRIWPALWGSTTFQGFYIYKNMTGGIQHLSLPESRQGSKTW